MKVLFGKLVFALILAALCLFVTSTDYTQTIPAECSDGYQKFLANRTGPELDKFKTSLVAGKDYLAKCGEVEGQEDIKSFVTKQIPKIEETVKIKELENRFNNAVPNKNWDDALASGKELVAMKHPGSLDILITFASIGYVNAAADPPIDKYYADAIRQAKLVLQKLNEGAVSENYGEYQFKYQTKACSDGKANTISWMNYTIGYILYNRQKQTKEGIPYLVKANQAGCELKDYPEVYRLVGAWYFDEMLKLNTTRMEKLKLAGDQETDETRLGLALINGYADRAIDAYSRAYKNAKERTDMPQAYKDALYKRLLTLFDSRHDGKHDGFDQYVAGVMNSPFPDPETPVMPVVEPTPVQVPPPPKIAPKHP